MVNLTGPMRKLVVDNPIFYFFFPKTFKSKITYSRRLNSEAPFISFYFFLFTQKYKEIKHKESANVYQEFRYESNGVVDFLEQ